jgi:hypothetical protein
MVVCDDIRMMKSLQKTDLASEFGVVLNFYFIFDSNMLDDVPRAIFAEGRNVILRQLSSLQQNALNSRVKI